MDEDQELVAAFAEWWAKVGLTAELDPTDLPDLKQVLSAHGFAIVRRMDPDLPA